MTSPPRTISYNFFMLAALLLLSCAHRDVSALVTGGDRAQVEDDLRAYRRYALEPAGIAPPTVSWEDRDVSAGGLTARATPIRPEDAAWNRWPDGSSRLFNNRVAHLFLVRIEGVGPLAWTPERTTLELNEETTRLEAAASAEGLLGELTFWAVMQERWVLPGDLAARTRASGPFRASYLPLRSDGDVLEGLVAFPMHDPTSGAPNPGLADLHVVAMRLTIAVETPDGPERLVWLFR